MRKVLRLSMTGEERNPGTSGPGDLRGRSDQREATAEVASIAEILRPRSVAVVGAGRYPGNVGHEVVRSLLIGDFSGTVYPVNLSARAVCGVPAPAVPVGPVWRGISALPSGRRASEADGMSVKFRRASVTGRGAAPAQPPGAYLIDWRAARRAGRACCCPARPVVIAVMPRSAARPHETDLLLCGHHYRASRLVLAAVGATVVGIDGTPVAGGAWPPVLSGV
jgi:hypothetical protein